MARYDDIDTRTVAFATVVSAISLVIIILAGRAMAYAWQFSAEDHRNNTAKFHSSDEVIAGQKSLLKISGEVQEPPTEEGGTPITRLRIPIKRAAELIGKELQPAKT